MRLGQHLSSASRGQCEFSSSAACSATAIETAYPRCARWFASLTTQIAALCAALGHLPRLRLRHLALRRALFAACIPINLCQRDLLAQLVRGPSTATSCSATSAAADTADDFLKRITAV